MKTPLISVVMSVYNGETYLEKSINSILNQTFRDFEFIIIDDHSTDSSYEIIQKFAIEDNRIQIIRKDKNIGIQGFIQNLNIGCSQAKGKYIARMDQDDISKLDRFEKQYNFLEANPAIFMVGSNINIIDEKGDFQRIMKAPTGSENILREMTKKVSLYHPVIMFRNGYPKSYYREKMLFCEDYDFYLRLLSENFKLGNIDEELLDYRIVNNSMSRNDNKLIKRLFYFKAKQFYNERLETGTDSYNQLNVSDFNNIYKEVTPKETLVYSIKVAKKCKDYKSFLFLIDKYKNQFNLDFFYIKNYALSKFGKRFLIIYSKLINI